MLFTTVPEIKAHHRITLSFYFNDIAPYLQPVEEDYIIEVISQSQYDALQLAYDASLATNPVALTLPLKKLLNKVRDVLAPLAFHYYIPSATAATAQSGLMVIDNGDQSHAPKWMVDRMMADAHKRAMMAIDRLYKFLEENQADYPLWKASDSYTVFKSCFINTVKDFEKFIKIGNSRRTFIALKPIMERIELSRIESTISPELFDEIKDEILQDNLSIVNKKLLQSFIHPALVQLTMAQAMLDLPVTIDEKGVTLYEEEKSSISEDKKNTYSKNRQAMGESDLAALSTFLYKNHSDYPTFESSTSYTPLTENYFINESNSRVAGMM